MLKLQRVRRVVGAWTVNATVGVLPMQRVTSLPVVRRVKTVAGQVATATWTSTSVWNVQISVVNTPTVSTSTAPTPASVTTGTNERGTAVNVS